VHESAIGTAGTIQEVRSDVRSRRQTGPHHDFLRGPSLIQSGHERVKIAAVQSEP
jgi:hypothetical protein